MLLMALSGQGSVLVKIHEIALFLSAFDTAGTKKAVPKGKCWGKIGQIRCGAKDSRNFDVKCRLNGTMTGSRKAD